MRKNLLALGFVILVLNLGGCKYLRLLQFKSQFQNVPKNFVFIKTLNNPSIKCLYPLLKPEDVAMLTDGVTPVVVKHNSGFEQRYVMKKINTSSNDTDTSLVITLFFDQNDTLTQIYYPHQFSSLIHPDFVPNLLEKFGNGQPDVQSKSIKSSGTVFPDAWVPNREKILAHLGMPTQEITSKNTTLLVYTYTIQSAPKPTHPYILITLDNKSQKAVGVKTTVFGGEISLQSH